MTPFRNSVVFFTILTMSSALMAQRVPQRGFNVMDFGAKGDGKTLDSKAIQEAVNACGEIGGVVLFPPGRYLTGSIELKSNVELHLERGATLLGSTNLSDYVERIPSLKSYNDVFLKYSLLYAERQTNIAITGYGTIDGQGSAFVVLSKKKPDKYKNRPYIIRFVECSNISIENVTLKNSASWMQHFLACEGLSIRGVSVFNHANLNNDMMDIDGCRNVVVSDCIGDTDDDGITLKSTSERITENVTITNCIVSSHCNAVKTGTESTGGFRNIVISNIVVKPSAVTSVLSGKPGGVSGISLTNVDGGILEGISISNLVIDGPEVPIFVRLGDRGRKYWEGAPQPGIGAVKGITISNVTAKNVGSIGCAISGLPDHPVQDITLKNVRMAFAGGVVKKPEVGLDELEGNYPESTMWGLLPAYGVVVRHAEGVRLEGVTMTFNREDYRPAIVLDDAQRISLSGLDASISDSAGSVLDLRKVKEVDITGSTVRGHTNALLRFIGSENASISVLACDLKGIAKICEPPDTSGGVVFSSGNRIGQ